MLTKKTRRTALAAVTALCVFGMTACGGQKKSGDNLEMGVYSFEEKELNDGSEGRSSYISNSYLKGNEFYYMRYIEPDYPESWEEDLKKLDMEGIDGLGTPDDEIISENEEIITPDDSAQDDTADTPSDDNPEDISDDDLVGDIDDLFGDNKPDDAPATAAPEEGKEPDDASGSDTMTWEEFEEKYKDYKTTMKLFKYNIDTGETVEMFDFNGDEEGNVYSYYIDDEGRFVMLYQKYNDGSDDGSYASKYSIITKDAEGNDVSDIDITDAIKSDSQEEFWFNRTMFGEDGYLYVSYTQGESDKTTLCRVKTDGTLAGQVQVDDYVDTMIFDNEGNMVISYYSKDGLAYYYADFDKGALGEQLKMSDDDNGNSQGSLLSGHGDITFFTKDSTGLYKYDAESKEKTMILKWLDCGLVGDNVNEVVPLEDGRIFCICNDMEGNTKVGILEKSEVSQADKKVIKLGSVYSSGELQEKVIAFNKSNDEYKIEVVNYENQEDPEKAFANDIIAGNIPDIIDVSNVDLDNYIGKGILEDLTPYLEKDDTVNKDFFVDGVLDATAVDGKNYYLVNNFYIMTLAAKASDVKDYAGGWTVQDMIDYYNSKPEGTELIEYQTKESVFYDMVGSDIGNYIDWKTGEVKFDTEEFRSVIEFCNKFPKENEYDEESKTYTKIKDGMLLLNTLYLNDLEEFQVYRRMFDDDIAYIGYPSGDKKGTYMNVSEASLAMATVSENKDAVWEFMKYVATERVKGIYRSGIPASKAEFERMVKEKTTTEEYVDEDGETIRPLDSTYGYNDLEVNIKPSSEEDVQMLKDLIKESKVTSNNYEIISMVEEEVNNYFEGTKSLDDVVKIIQDKLSKYVNENK